MAPWPETFSKKARAKMNSHVPDARFGRTPRANHEVSTRDQPSKPAELQGSLPLPYGMESTYNRLKDPTKERSRIGSTLEQAAELEDTSSSSWSAPQDIGKGKSGENNGPVELLGDSQVPFQASQAGAATLQDLALVERTVREASRPISADTDNLIRTNGVPAALKAVLHSLQPSLHMQQNHGNIERKLREALDGEVREKRVNDAFKDRGIEGILDLLLQNYERGQNAEQAIFRAKSLIQEALVSRPKHELDFAHKQEGVVGLLKILIQDYVIKSNQALTLGRVEAQLGKLGHRLSQRDYDAELKAKGIESALRLVIKSYQSCISADAELNLVKGELKKAARGFVPDYELDNSLKKNGTSGALKLLVKNLNTKVQNLEANLANTNSRSAVRERDNSKMSRDISELKKGHAQYQAKVNEMKKEHEMELTTLNLNWAAKQQKQQDEAASQLRNFQERHKAESSKQQAEHKADQEKWENALQTAIKKHNSDTNELKHVYDTQTTRIQAESEARERQARQAEMTKMEKLRQDHEALKGLLVKRQHFKGLSDPEITTLFKKLAGDVDSFSRLPWEKKKEAYWPPLPRSDNPRRMKQHMVQSSIWFILNQNIFCSPFQIFGEEGRKMHDDWIQTYGEDRQSQPPYWPVATEESEKWRYELVKECLDSLGRSATDSDIRRRWKIAYDDSVVSTVDALTETIEAISSLTTHDRQIVQGFVLVAAKFWLEMAAQKCRVLLVFPSSSTNVLRVRKALAGTELVVQPEVRRKGNSQGLRLDNEQVVNGCVGDYIPLPAR